MMSTGNCCRNQCQISVDFVRFSALVFYEMLKTFFRVLEFDGSFPNTWGIPCRGAQGDSLEGARLSFELISA